MPPYSTTSESNLVSAKAAYEKSRIELDRATGLLLDHTGINVADATRGQVTHLPKVPYVSVPRQDQPLPRGRSRRVGSVRKAPQPSGGQRRNSRRSRVHLDLINSPVMERASLPAMPRSVLWMVLLSFLLQVAAIGVFRQYHTRPEKIISALALRWAAWAVPSPGAGFQQSLWREHRAQRLGAAALSLPDWRSLQSFWHLHLRLGMGTAVDQQSLRRAHHHSGFSDCAPNLWPARRTLVGASMGA